MCMAQLSVRLTFFMVYALIPFYMVHEMLAVIFDPLIRASERSCNTCINATEVLNYSHPMTSVRESSRHDLAQDWFDFFFCLWKATPGGDANEHNMCMPHQHEVMKFWIFAINTLVLTLHRKYYVVCILIFFFLLQGVGTRRPTQRNLTLCTYTAVLKR